MTVLDIAQTYCTGEGLEIGALNRPLGIAQTYCDFESNEALRARYPEIADIQQLDFVADIITLPRVHSMRYDFIIACHVLEHIEDPMRAVYALLDTVKPGGRVFLTVPDMTTMFDRDRIPTPFTHILDDFQYSHHSLREHHREWATLVNKVTDETEIHRQIEENIRTGYPIHYHSWTPKDFLEFIHAVARSQLTAFLSLGNDIVTVLTKEKP